MAEVRCPMCGESNPGERDTCLFCQARLKPVQLSEILDDLPSGDHPGLEKSAEADADLPDWLRAMRQRSETALQSDEVEEEIPEWMQETAATDQEELPANGAEAVLDWPNNQDLDIELESEAEPGDVEQDFTFEEVPEWLNRIQSHEEESDETTSDVEKDQREQGFPDWLNFAEAEISLLESEAGNERDETTAEQPDAEEIPEWLSSMAGPRADQEESTDLPDWLKIDETEQRLEASGTEEISASGEGEEQSGEELEWLKELESTVPAITIAPDEIPDVTNEHESPQFSTEEEVQADFETLYGGVLPDWLMEITPQEESPADEVAVEEKEAEPASIEIDQDEPDLAPAEIPIWLEAMRPVESVAGPAPVIEEDQEEEVSAGPLAGLSGILPAELAIPQIQKPPTYLLKLQVTESQQSHANLFEQLLSNEAEAQPIPKQTSDYSQPALRLAIALVLIMAILWSIVTDVTQGELPAFSVETALTSQMVAGLNNGEPVLLAFDYEPGFSAEMDNTAAATIDHLMRGGSYLTLVSTSPTGPAQAERLLAKINQRAGHEYHSPDRYTNLGFIPGGPAGLLSFAQTPRHVLPLRVDGEPAWQIEPLQSVDSLSDFSLILVITENPDNARAWIEQARPYLENTPLVMAVSAQAEPIVRPYYEANPSQVQGLISGLAGGIMYENLMGQSDTASNYWTPFSIGLLVASLLILAGGVFNAISTLLLRRKDNAGGEKSR